MRKPCPTTKKTAAWAVAMALAATAMGCGEDPETKNDEKKDAVEEDSSDRADTARVFQFDDDTNGEDPMVAADGEQSGAADTSAATDAGAAAEDAGPAVVTSCQGKCGLYLDGNACHCTAACTADGDCCADFAVACGCQSHKDCDDNNVCTTDSCQAGSCKQIPFQNCCMSDAECKGSTSCKKATCLDGSCALVAKNCDDGLTCTVDLCDEKSGACVNKLPPTKCLIDGFCASAAEKKPGSAGCELCQPDIDPGNWTAKAGTCLIDGKCYASGTENPAVTCQVCDTKSSATGWSVKSGHCFVDGVCYVSGQNPAGSGAACAVCKPSASKTGWSGTPGTCAVGSGAAIKCLKKGDPGPSGTCAVCDPGKSTAGYTLQPGWCLIVEKCVKSGSTGLAENVCSVCEPTKNTTAWTPKKAGNKCDDGDACSSDTLCNAMGKCVGKTLPGCCKSHAECDHLKATAPKCSAPVCLKSTGKCELKKLTSDKCCTEGKCCDAKSQQVKPKATKCSDFKVSTEYQCNDKAVEQRDLFPGCSGVHGKECKTGSEFHAGGPWKIIKTCGEKQTCTFENASTQPQCK